MHTRFLGRSDLEVSDIGFGCMSLTSLDQAREVIGAAWTPGSRSSTRPRSTVRANEQFVGEVLQPVPPPGEDRHQVRFQCQQWVGRAQLRTGPHW